MKQICMKSPVSDSVLRTLRFSFSRLQKKRKWLSYVLAQLCFLLERKYFALWRNVLCEWRIQTSQDDCLAQMQGASHIPHLCWATTGWNKDFNFWNPQWREKGDALSSRRWVGQDEIKTLGPFMCTSRLGETSFRVDLSPQAHNQIYLTFSQTMQVPKSLSLSELQLRKSIGNLHNNGSTCEVRHGLWKECSGGKIERRMMLDLCRTLSGFVKRMQETLFSHQLHRANTCSQHTCPVALHATSSPTVTCSFLFLCEHQVIAWQK